MDTRQHDSTDLTDGQWYFVCQQEGLSVAHAAERLWFVANGVRLLLSVEPKRCLETAHEHLAKPETPASRSTDTAPSAGCVDSQSVKAATQGQDIGFDGGKKVKGRKRHGLVNTLGLILAVVVTAANTSDQKGLKALLTDYFTTGVRRLRKLWVDGGYNGFPLAA